MARLDQTTTRSVKCFALSHQDWLSQTLRRREMSSIRYKRFPHILGGRYFSYQMIKTINYYLVLTWPFCCSEHCTSATSDAKKHKPKMVPTHTVSHGEYSQFWPIWGIKHVIAQRKGNICQILTIFAIIRLIILQDHRELRELEEGWGETQGKVVDFLLKRCKPFNAVSAAF